MNYKKYKFIIGIDPGTTTGICVWNVSDRKIFALFSSSIVFAMDYIIRNFYNENILIRFEDARQRTWFGKAGVEQLQGAGSIKRDCTIWETFCEFWEFDFEAVSPRKNATKKTATYFQKLTGWQQKTNEHQRDAAALVYGL